MSHISLDAVIAEFGRQAHAKLTNPAITGEPEDQLRGPLEILVTAGFAPLADLPANSVRMVGETRLADIRTRPDYAVTVNNALVGFVEVKAPGKGADPRRFRDHDKAQWERLKSLPNLVYTDGNAFSLWRDGELVGSIIHLDGDIETSVSKLKAPPTLPALWTDFLTWQPVTPRNPRRLAEIAARLCRLLREEVADQLDRKHSALTDLSADWKKLLFPQASDAEFADGYAQAVTFGLLIARARGIELANGIDAAAADLRKTSSLIGTALALLTGDPENQRLLETSLGTMRRVFDKVNWPDISKDDEDAWLYFYEHFLEVYDNTLRKRTGSYYTPPEVVNAMVGLVDEALRGPLFERSAGLAADDVTVADPAVGTGTFLLGVLRRIAATASADLGPGAVPGAIAAATERLIGFEIQFGPFAVAQLRLIAELRELTGGLPPTPKLYITDTLANPFVEEEWLPQVMQPIARSRREANAIKKGQPITVVIGNPPYKEKAEGRGGWIEAGGGGKSTPPMERWRPPVEWGVSAHTKHLKNLYVYFWRWASWKVFGAGHYAATGLKERDEEGIVCFITVAGFLNGPGFQKMRDDLRRSATDIFVIDCSPEGHQPEVATRVFEGVQQPVCIVLAAKKFGKAADQPARVRFRSLPPGRRKAKFDALAALRLDDGGWTDAPQAWRAPFLPAASGVWAAFPMLADLFHYNGSGVMPGRTWVIAPDRQTLEQRWRRLIDEPDPEVKEALFHPQLRDGKVASRHIRKVVLKDLGAKTTRSVQLIHEVQLSVQCGRYAFRSFDRQWLIEDSRLLNDPRPELWDSYSAQQVFITGLERSTPSGGPSLTITGLIPDQDHYKGSFGGRVYPLWRDAEATIPNVRADRMARLAEAYGVAVSAEDVIAYVAAVMAHPAFTLRFADDLKQPGLRLPITADRALFLAAVALGREVVWLHCYGERFHDAAAGRPKAPPRLPDGEGPVIPAAGAIPGAPAPLPDDMSYDAGLRRLVIGDGHIDNVPPEVWAYEVSGKQVLRQWFSYRRRDRSRPVIGDRRPPSRLEEIQPESWLPEYTADLMNLLHVLGRLVRLEAAQAELLTKIVDGPLLDLADEPAAGND